MEDELKEVRIKDDFYRDGFAKALTTLVMIVAGIVILTLLSIYLYTSKPEPEQFKTYTDFRVLSPIALNQPYLNTADLTQWVSDAISDVFNYDFVNYSEELKSYAHYFTENGWERFNDFINNYANEDTVVNNKQFISASLTGAPTILNQGLIEGKYGWWIQMPLNVRYSSVNKNDSAQLLLQVLVVRTPTTNNLSGVAIDNMILASGGGG